MTTLKILSYNLEKLGETKDPVELKAKADIVLREDPDVAIFQEAGSLADFRSWVTRFFPADRRWGYLGDSEGRSNPMGQGFICKPSVHVEGAYGTLVDLESDDPKDPKYGPRPLLDLHLVKNNIPLTLMGAHLSATNIQNRWREAETVAETALTEMVRNPFFIMMGDFNLQRKAGHGLDILKVMTLQEDGQELPHSVQGLGPLRELPSDRRRFYPTHQSRQKLDYAYCSPSLTPWVDPSHTGVRGKLNQSPWREASDHLPYQTALAFPASFRHTLEGNDDSHGSESFPIEVYGNGAVLEKSTPRGERPGRKQWLV